MYKHPTYNPADQLAQWEIISCQETCGTSGILTQDDIKTMVARVKRSEAALTKIAGARVYGTPDATSRAQIEALIDIAKESLSQR